MKPNTGRNSPCTCGSGLKSKNCCEGPRAKGLSTKRNVPIYVFLAAAAVLIIAVFLMQKTGAGSSPNGAGGPGAAPPGKVWSAEHGHWHDVP